MHGTRDRVTSLAASRRMARAMVELGADVTYEAVEGEGHAMLRRPRLWHRRASEYLAHHLVPDR
jgi:dipeptidyl aminopeptidase/acylaminoacyl peptidase